MHHNVLAVVSGEAMRNVSKLIGGWIYSRQYPEKYREWNSDPVLLIHEVHEALAVLPFSFDEERIMP
jgi:hypothetical protein